MATWAVLPNLNQVGGALQLKFSQVGDDISHQNPVSKSNIPHVDVRQDWPIYEAQKPTFWGHGLPLAHEVAVGKLYGQHIPTLAGANVKVSPSCCPSPYSTDKGCLCYSRVRKHHDWSEMGASTR